MKAALVSHRTEPLAISDVPVPQPGKGEVQVRVLLAGVNPIDWKMRERAAKQLPFVAGQDFAGIVTAVGDGAYKYRLDDRVFGIAREHGAYAEYTILPEDDRTQPMAKIPDGVGDADAAALPTAGLTALACIEALALRAGETVLVLGATGGVGGYAVQIARDRGVAVAGVAAAAGESLAREFGASQFVAYDRADVPAEVRRLYPQGVDAIVDLVDDAGAAKTTAELLRPGGRIVSTIGALDEHWLRERGWSGSNIVLFETPQSSHEGLRTLAEMVERGSLRVVIAAEHPLVEAERALEVSRSGSVSGKLLLTIG